MDVIVAQDVIWLALTFILAVVMSITLLIWGRSAAPARARTRRD
jgi:hypothetical protein